MYKEPVVWRLAFVVCRDELRIAIFLCYAVYALYMFTGLVGSCPHLV